MKFFKMTEKQEEIYTLVDEIYYNPDYDKNGKEIGTRIRLQEETGLSLRHAMKRLKELTDMGVIEIDEDRSYFTTGKKNNEYKVRIYKAI